jgi:hypothetical protein
MNATPASAHPPRSKTADHGITQSSKMRNEKRRRNQRESDT